MIRMKIQSGTVLWKRPTSWRWDQCRCRWLCPCRGRCQGRRVFQWRTPWTSFACPAYPATLTITMTKWVWGSNNPIRIHLFPTKAHTFTTFICRLCHDLILHIEHWKHSHIDGKSDNGRKHSEHWFSKWYKSKRRLTSGYQTFKM